MQFTTTDIAKGGYCVDSEKNIYRRDSYRHKLYPGDKKRCEKIEEIARSLYENLTVSRVKPHLVSIRSAFISDL